MRIGTVPPNAEAALKNMKEARFGARAVATLRTKNMMAVTKATYTIWLAS